MRTLYDIEVEITDENSKRIKTKQTTSTFRFSEELTDVAPFTESATTYFEKFCKRKTEQFQQVIKENLMVHDVSVRYIGNETWPLLYSYYPKENRFIVH